MNDRMIDRPFSEELFKKSSKLAQDYHMTIEKHDRLGFIGNCTEIPTVYFDGKTKENCEKSGRKAITVAIATMLEMGRNIPEAQKI